MNKNIYETYEQIKAELKNNVDLKYKAFNDPIMNCEYGSLGVRTPVVKKLAKLVPIERRNSIMSDFFADKERLYETVLFAGCLAARKKDYAVTREYMNKLIPLFGSWAHTDCIIPLLRWADTKALWHDFRYLLDCNGGYEKRFYIIMMMDCALNDEYIDKVLETLEFNVVYGDYYVDMAAAWLLAECLVKFYDKTLPLFIKPIFPKFVHNKAIQKARESFRIPLEIKQYLNTLKIK